MNKRCWMVVWLLLLPALWVHASDRQTPVVSAVAKARGAVVNIRTEKIVQRHNSSFFGFGDSFFDQFFQDLLPQRKYTTQSLGSGVIIDVRGHILTNAHVVDKASKIFVALAESPRELEAQLIGADEHIDLAVLKIIDSGEYPWLPPGRSDDLMLGETVIAIGNPLGLGHSITTGIISSISRRIQINERFSAVFIQTDALINPGNSGGPLININGELIGINTAIARQAQGIGFSIPIDTVNRVLNDLISYGYVRRGYVGIDVGAVGSSFVRSTGTSGVLIEEIQSASPAKEAGLKAADVILAIDEAPISSPEQYSSLLRTYTPGDRLVFRVLRGGRQLEKILVLSVLPDGYEMSYTRRVFGFELVDGRQGPVISKVIKNSAADQVGLRSGDLIVKIEDAETPELSTYQRRLLDYLGRRPVTFTVVRNNSVYLVKLP